MPGPVRIKAGAVLGTLALVLPLFGTGHLLAQGVTLNVRPRREAQFAVLTAAGFPSVLIEAGFLSNAQDRSVLATAEGRARISRAVKDTVALLAR